MRERRVQKLLLSAPAPDELAAQRRAWRIVKAAYEEREPVRWPRRNARPLIALALCFALVAGVLTSPGRAVLDSLRDVVGREKVVGVKRAQPALFRLPTGGRLLVNTRRGPWVVNSDGSKRLLGQYEQASWSPHGWYIVASRRLELLAIKPGGTVRWSLPRRGTITAVRWAPGDGYRVAYLSDENVRVVGGNGSGDRLLLPARAPASFTAIAWRPRAQHVLAVADRVGRVSLYAVDSNRLLWRSGRTLSRSDAASGSASDETPFKLDWSADGRRVLVVSQKSVRILAGNGRTVGRLRVPTDAVDAEFASRSRRFALIRFDGRRSQVSLFDADRPARAGRQLFDVPGRIADVTWSPDDHWLLLGWQSANQWVFIPLAGGKVRAVSNVSLQFHSRRKPAAFPDVAQHGWCCATSP